MSKKEKTIRIAHIVGKWVGGGVESNLMNYFRNIDRNQVQFDFICDSDSIDIPKEEIESLGGKVIIIPPYQKVFKYHKELKKVLKNGNYKIVHSHINTLSMFSLFAAKCAKIPVRIAHSHSTTNKLEWKKNILKQIFKLFSKMFATHYMACTEYAGKWMFGEKEYKKNNIYVLNNAIELDKFKYNEKVRTKVRKELSIKEDTLVIGHIGRFMEVKNHEFLLDTFDEIHKKNNNSILLLAGQGPLLEKIKKKVNDLNLNDSVIFLGQRKDIEQIYQAFDVFVLPSLYEGLGMVLIEAQCSGLPTIASTEVPTIAKVSNNFKFVELNKTKQEWAEVILESVKNYKRHDCIKECQQCGYDIKLESPKLIEYYKNVVGD
ncbi:MAG: glycosyltransferase family 1 protein [Lactobacillales bacterium]|nr:glycosyltransferase family 1 protein [Lactobacillales bacterium]